MKALIIEDEPLAAHSLKKLIGEVSPDIHVITVLQSIDETLEWFSTHRSPDLVFMDIHLADGSSFSIFEHVEIRCPVIFTTAYDQYALKAFEVNSVDYLLKPISKPDLERALNKIKVLRLGENEQGVQSEILCKLLESFRQKPSVYKSSFLVSVKDKLVPVAAKDIAYFNIDNKIVSAVTFDGRTHVMDMTMDECMAQLDPSEYYRANRQYIVSRSAVKDVSIWFGGKLAVNLVIGTPERIFVSRTNAREFKQWLTL